VSHRAVVTLDEQVLFLVLCRHQNLAIWKSIVIRLISTPARFLTVVLVLASANPLFANERLLKAVERHEAVWIGKTTVVTDESGLNTKLLSIRGDLQVAFSRMDFKAGNNDFVNFRYISLPLRQSLNHMRRAGDLSVQDLESPYLGDFLDSDSQEGLTKSLELYHSVVDLKFLSEVIKGNRDKTIIRVVSENRFVLTLASGSKVEIEIDQSERITKLESEMSVEPPAKSASGEKRRLKTVVVVNYDSEDAVVPYGYTITSGERSPYTLRLATDSEFSFELTDKLQLPGIAIPDGIPVSVTDHENDSYVLLGGRIVAVVDSQIVADAQKARKANSSGAWRMWYATWVVVMLVFSSALWWLRRSKVN